MRDVLLHKAEIAVRSYLSIKIFGYQFPDDDDFWDGNSLVAGFEVQGRTAHVHWKEPCLRTDELSEWSIQLVDLLKGEADEARLDPAEDWYNLRIVRRGRPDRFEMLFSYDSGPMFGYEDRSTHEFAFAITKEDVDQLMRQIVAVLDQFPVRGE